MRNWQVLFSFRGRQMAPLDVLLYFVTYEHNECQHSVARYEHWTLVVQKYFVKISTFYCLMLTLFSLCDLSYTFEPNCNNGCFVLKRSHVMPWISVDLVEVSGVCWLWFYTVVYWRAPVHSSIGTGYEITYYNDVPMIQ